MFGEGSLGRVGPREEDVDAGQGWGADRRGHGLGLRDAGGVERTWILWCLLRRGVCSKEPRDGSDSVLRYLPATAGGGTRPSVSAGRVGKRPLSSLGTPLIRGGFLEESAGTWAPGRWFLVGRLYLAPRGLEEPRGWGLMRGSPCPPACGAAGMSVRPSLPAERSAPAGFLWDRNSWSLRDQYFTNWSWGRFCNFVELPVAP